MPTISIETETRLPALVPVPVPEPAPAVGVPAPVETEPVPEVEIRVALEVGTPEVVGVGVVMLAGGLQADPSAMVYRPGTTFQQPLVEMPEREEGRKEIMKR